MARPKAIIPVSVEETFINMLVYGEPGVGKTVLAGTSPNCLILESSTDGSESAALRGSKAMKWKMDNWEDMLEAEEYLRHNPDEFEWVWFDSITLFQELGLDNIMEELVKTKQHRDRYVPDQHEYLQNMNRLSLWMRSMKSHPFNFGVTAHVLRTEDEDDGRVTYMPYIQGRNMPQKISGYMGVVAYMSVAQVKAKGSDSTQERRKLATKNVGKFYAKDRFDVIGTMYDPTIPEIVKKVKAAMPARSTRRPVKKATAAKKTAKRPVKKTTARKAASIRN